MPKTYSPDKINDLREDIPIDNTQKTKHNVVSPSSLFNQDKELVKDVYLKPTSFVEHDESEIGVNINKRNLKNTVISKDTIFSKSRIEPPQAKEKVNIQFNEREYA